MNVLGMRINGCIGHTSRFTVDGVDGYFTCRTARMFTHVNHHRPGAGYKLVASVSIGNYGDGNIKPCGNPSYTAQILGRLEKYLIKIGGTAVEAGLDAGELSLSDLEISK